MFILGAGVGEADTSVAVVVIGRRGAEGAGSLHTDGARDHI